MTTKKKKRGSVREYEAKTELNVYIRTIQHNNLMRRIYIQTLIQRERNRVIVQGRIGREAMLVWFDGLVFETREELLDPACALDAGYG